MPSLFYNIVFFLLLSGVPSMPVDLTDFTPSIEVKPWWLGIRNEHEIVTFWGTIYTDKYTVPLLQNPRTVWAKGLVVHETVHARRQLTYGKMLWHIKYLVDADFRWEEERLAYEAQFAFLSETGNMELPYDQDKFLQILSGPVYNYMVSYNIAAKWLVTELDKNKG